MNNLEQPDARFTESLHVSGGVKPLKSYFVDGNGRSNKFGSVKSSLRNQTMAQRINASHYSKHLKTSSLSRPRGVGFIRANDSTLAGSSLGFDAKRLTSLYFEDEPQ